MSSRLLQTRLFRSESAHAEHLSLFRSVLVLLCKLCLIAFHTRYVPSRLACLRGKSA